MTVVDIFENLIGDKLCQNSIHALIEDENLIIKFCELLASYYTGWLEAEKIRSAGLDESRYLVFGSFYGETNPLEKLDYKKLFSDSRKFLLYCPSFILPDPVASVYFTYYLLKIDFINDKFKLELKESLLVLAEIAPALNGNDIILMPVPFILDLEDIQVLANEELDALDEEPLHDEYYRPLRDIAVQNGMFDYELYPHVESAKLFGQICTQIDLVPVASDALFFEILRQDHKVAYRNLVARNVEHRVTETLFKYNLPGIGKASFKDIIDLRNNEDAFYEWRTTFKSIIEEVGKETILDENHFLLELKKATEDKINPRIKELEKTTKVPIIENMLVPSGVSIASTLFGIEFLSLPWKSGLLSASVTIPTTWIVKSLIKKYDKAGLRAECLKKFYGYLI